MRAQEVDKDAEKETESAAGSGARQLLGMKGASDEDNIWKIRLQLTKPVTWVPLIWGTFSLWCSTCRTSQGSIDECKMEGFKLYIHIVFFYVALHRCESPCRCWMWCSCLGALPMEQSNDDWATAHHHDHGRPLPDWIYADYQ